VLTFAFLALSGAVGVWQNLVTGRFTLGTAWCVTNAVVLGAFIAVAIGESRRARRPARSARRSPPPTRPRRVDAATPVSVPVPRRPDLVARHVREGRPA
jgi:cellulose synthase (UDP-forming)